ncbi:serine/threonine-protein phosphatase 4 regulatory subunit 3-A [Striga asiatica]|uniref:Serine/threonine-protein phosphatase 4 regulatory subunit 3-A n=1 Tax=Striga asiatica TaxID=4170 RepID=A0A5A7R184_STRAF|nr:serine/threonine-protein phosphatase 4 regulatory subunit 3-A [Striga asiatica]
MCSTASPFKRNNTSFAEIGLPEKLQKKFTFGHPKNYNWSPRRCHSHAAQLPPSHAAAQLAATSTTGQRSSAAQVPRRGTSVPSRRCTSLPHAVTTVAPRRGRLRATVSDLVNAETVRYYADLDAVQHALNWVYAGLIHATTELNKDWQSYHVRDQVRFSSSTRREHSDGSNESPNIIAPENDGGMVDDPSVSTSCRCIRQIRRGHMN